MFSVWLRIIRIKFLLASVIGITVGLTYAYYNYMVFDFFAALLTYIGVIFLHASVDVFNDYWDFKRGIDTSTKRTKYSGGTGVLPENKISPKMAYRMGLIFLILGITIGIYFVIQSGFFIAIILAIAVVSIYFYSTTIVNIGLGELLVAIKGAMIVIGTVYVQVQTIDLSLLPISIIIGSLSSIVLFVASFPDYEADRSKGRRTLVILLGKKKGSLYFPFFIIVIYSLIIFSIFLEYLPLYAFLSFLGIFFAYKAVKRLREDFENHDKLVDAIQNTIVFSRIVGISTFLSFIISIIINMIK
ncbi:MAG: prenyltransferase [Nitrososphaeraceae archaeon]